ncbi:MAG: ribosome biogenesis factor YjgA [Burkholderiales bacterium]
MPPRAESHPEPENDDIEPWERPSKTQRKKESHDLQSLGEDLVALPDDRLDGLPMDESLRDALRTYKKTRSHEGRRRQMQYVGKLMRRADPEPLREAVAALKLGTAKASLALHELEHWRAQMLASDDALTPWMKRHPDTDLQQLRSLVRAARKDAANAPEQRNGRAYRELFQLIKQQMASSSTETSAVQDDEPND